MSSSDATISPPSLEPEQTVAGRDALAAGGKGEKDIEELADATSKKAPKGWRKFLLVSLLCGAQLFDVFTACTAMAALPTVRR